MINNIKMFKKILDKELENKNPHDITVFLEKCADSVSTYENNKEKLKDIIEKDKNESEFKDFDTDNKLPEINLTENGAIAFKTTGNPILDLFISSVRDFDQNKIKELLEDAWLTDKEMTVQLIHNTRDVRTGKGEKKLGQYMMTWLRKNYLSTYLVNLESLMNVGYYKDLWKILETGNFSEDYPIECMYALLMLENDKLKLKDNKEISLMAKWIPKEGSKYGKYMRPIAKTLFKEKTYANFRKYLKPMREHLKIVESSMCTGKWSEIEYKSVPSICMKNNKKSFAKHDKIRFDEFLNRVKEGKEEIKVTGIQPHELINSLSKDNLEVTELQWSALIKRIKENTNLGKCLAVSDVSGSMSGTPMEVSIALGLLLSLVQESNINGKDNPFYRRIITFSEHPVLHYVKGNSLLEQKESVRNMPWTMNTNFVAVFKLLLETAKMYNVQQKDMIEKIFVFTDMQFDQASKDESPFEKIKKMYENSGYKIPQIIFWNLRNSSGGFPVQDKEKGVAYISGFSAELMRIFTAGEDFDPIKILKLALDKYKVKIHKNDL
jgi:hypothetical protein